MTAFLQGISQFVPEIQPYQPDLNFFGNMLATKQYQYDQGYNRINSIYSGLLNSPVLRQESSDRRDQFFRDIEQKIQKISTMDLSLEQNVNAAAKIFQPLIDDKDINYDMGMTRIWQTQMQRGQRLKNTMDPKVLENGIWWEGGDRAMNYWAQDFAKSSAEDMYKMPKPEYTPYLNIAKLASDQLEKMKFPMGVNPTWTPDGRYIIQGKGGPMAMAPLYNYLLNIYGNDPRVVKVAQTEAYLKRKDFVAQNATAMGGEQNAETQYLNNILNQVNAQAQRFQEQSTTNAKVAKAKTEVVANAIANGDMYDPDNTLAEILGSNQEQAQVEEGAAQFHSETLQITNPEVLQASDFASLRNRADSAVARDLLSEKLYSTAMNYAELNKEIKIEADPYAKAAFENALDRSNMLLQAQIDQAKMQLQSQLDISEMEYELYLKDYYGMGEGKGSGSGGGKGNNGVDDVNPNAQDGWELQMDTEGGGEGKDGTTEALTDKSVKALNEKALEEKINAAYQGSETFYETVDKLYDISVSADNSESLVARKAIIDVLTGGYSPEQASYFKELLQDKVKFASWYDNEINKIDITALPKAKARMSFTTGKDGKVGLDFSNTGANEKLDPGNYQLSVDRLRSALSDPAIKQILSKTGYSIDKAKNDLDYAGEKMAMYQKSVQIVAANATKVWDNVFKNASPLTKAVLDYRLDIEKDGDHYKAVYAPVDPNVEKQIMLLTEKHVNEAYKKLRADNPKDDSADLWQEAQESGEEFYVNSMTNYYRSDAVKNFEAANQYYKEYLGKNVPLYNHAGVNVTGNTDYSENDFFNSEATMFDSKLKNRLQARYEAISKEYNKAWNQTEGLETIKPALYDDPKGGGIATKAWRSDVDGAYAKNPGNRDFKSVYGDFQTYLQTHEKGDGSFTLFSGTLDPKDDLSDILEKGFNKEGYELLLQFSSDIANAGSWKSNQMTRPRALMYSKSLGNGYDAVTFRIDGGYIKGLKESAAKELTQEEQASESSSSSLSDARYYTIVAPEGTFDHINKFQNQDPVKEYTRLVGPMTIDYNNPGLQRFSGSTTISYDKNNKLWVTTGQINTLDENGNIIPDPQGSLNRTFTVNDNLEVYRDMATQLFENQNAQIIYGLRQLYQNNKKR